VDSALNLLLSIQKEQSSIFIANFLHDVADHNIDHANLKLSFSKELRRISIIRYYSRKFKNKIWPIFSNLREFIFGKPIDYKDFDNFGEQALIKLLSLDSGFKEVVDEIFAAKNSLRSLFPKNFLDLIFSMGEIKKSSRDY
jgi:hypothetical protein